MSIDRARALEDIGFAAAILIAVLYGIAETLSRLGLCPFVDRCAATSPSFPWGLAITQLSLVLPKTLGRATAGKIWSGVVAGLPFKVKQKSTDDAPSGSQPVIPTEDDGA